MRAEATAGGGGTASLTNGFEAKVALSGGSGQALGLATLGGDPPSGGRFNLTHADAVVEPL